MKSVAKGAGDRLLAGLTKVTRRLFGINRGEFLGNGRQRYLGQGRRGQDHVQRVDRYRIGVARL